MPELFEGLEELGFDNLKDIQIYHNGNEHDKKIQNLKEESQIDMLYDKTYICPVCDNQFKARTVKIGKARLIKVDTDFMPLYDKINPLFYDVIICPKCGYGAMISYFDKIKQAQKKLILDNITSKFKYKQYPDIYDLENAIERYKYALLNSIVKESKNSEKAYNCLKLSWMYRLKKDEINERKFLEQAYIGFKQAFETEPFPICNMDQHTLMYLIGECARRLGYESEALLWYGKVIVSRNAKPRIIELARDQKDFLRGKIQPDAN
ncbi:hypothetical protein ABG79_00132 [Caloramator mitchellensis]|uniref:DUF2225 domain-containing protein n=1 Tax=Caloramator mitchellensis TaxID=908809 RepID=A0A0R3K6C8_CALMK|nr:DUF2225 domain-containing protein [Caloramator mitchellensis]KRQ87967.1 hypothetical protein ABG79_00132 [Caloramator mitchellensis]